MAPVWRVELVKEGAAKWPSEQLRGPQDVFERFRPKMAALDRETFVVVMLDPQDRILGEHVVSVGALSMTVVDPTAVFRPAIAIGRCAHVVVVHNHPGGDPAPSDEDRKTTAMLMDAGRIVDIPVHDHIIIGGDSYFSFGEEAHRKHDSAMTNGT